MPTQLTRPLAVLAILLELAGLALNAFAVGWTCFDTCPPDPAGIRLRYGLPILLPGILLGAYVTLLALTALARQERRIAFSLLLAFPLAAIIAAALAGPLFPLDQYPSSSPSPSARALDLLIWSSLIFIITMLAILFAPITYRQPTHAKPPITP